MKSLIIVIVAGFLFYSAMHSGLSSMIDSVEAAKAERHAMIERVVNGK